LKNFAVYKSGAGSGKTFTLVKEYLRLALQHQHTVHFEFRRINAITFTNKAAAEMKWRILKALQDVINEESKAGALIQSLQTELKLGIEELKERASILLSNILHHYSDFAIGTIDSFTHKIVKTFAFDLQLPLNFNLETDVKTFYNKVVYQLLGQLGQDKELTSWLSEYALNKVNEDETWDPEKHLLEFTNLLHNEQSEKYIALLHQLSTNAILVEKEKINTFVQTFKKQLKEQAEPIIQLFEKNNLTDEDFTYKSSGPQRFFYKCYEGELGDKSKLINTRITSAIEKNAWVNTAGDAQKCSIIEQNANYLTSTAIQLITYINENYNDYKLFILLQKQIYPILLLKKLQDIAEQFKEDEQTVFLSEFNQRIAELVRTEPTPFIYERLGERYHHFLLDEFQDTGELQWQNILPLVDNALAAGYYNLIVGDGKQSIYRWRNANVEQFANLPYIKNSDENDLLKERELALVRNYEPKYLNKNFRSTKTVIEFNNAVFGLLSDKYLHTQHKTIYEHQAQEVNNDIEGYVTIFEKEVETTEKNELTLQYIDKHIAEALVDGFNYSDICVITRFNKSGNEVATFLTNKGIPVVSDDSLLLDSVFEVNVIVAMLTYLCNREDAIAPALVIHYLFQEKRMTLEEYHASLQEISKTKDLFSILQRFEIALYENNLRLSNLFDTVCTIMNTLSLHKKNDTALRFFLDMVNEFLVNYSSNLVAFLDWWENKKSKASLIVPDNANAVKIMSIHASKGLEFPVVIAPFINWQLYKFDNKWVEIDSNKTNLKASVVKVSKALEEAGLKEVYDVEEQLQNLDNLNLLYVQFTRAIHRLHIIAIHSKGGQKNSSDWLADIVNTLATTKEEYFSYWGKRTSASIAHKKTALPLFELQTLQIEPQSDVIKIKSAFQLDANSEQSYAREKGILIHYILAKIKSLDDVAMAIESACNEGLLNTNAVTETNELIQQIISHPQLHDFFKPNINVKTEAEILGFNGSILRPDRLIIENKHITIIDYKTGEQQDDKYAQQLQTYEDACLALGFTSITKYLVYLNPIYVQKLA
jgi:ATP-dependent exoDNAse (exonuclease V) beta subunit